MVEFYTTVIGLKVQYRENDRAILGDSNEPLISLLADTAASKRGRNETGLFHTAFLVPSRTDLGNALARIEKRWQLDGASDHRVSEALYLSDPEDNGIEVYRDRPREEWPRTDEWMVEIDTLPLDLNAICNCAQEETTISIEMTVGHVHLEVSSLSAAREFYVDTLGMRMRQQYGNSVLFLDHGDYHHRLGVNVWNGRTSPAMGCGLQRFEFVLPKQDALDIVQQQLNERGVLFTTTDRGLEVTDPDDISIKLIAEDSAQNFTG